MSKLNLSEAAKEILTKSVKSAGGESFGLGKKLSADEQGNVEVGSGPTKTNDQNPSYTKGVPTATPPGAKPPVGAEAMKKLATQPGDNAGRADLKNSSESDQEDEQSVDAIANRVAAKKPKSTMTANKGAECCVEGEEEEEYEDEDELEEASVEEVMEDFDELSEEEFEEKYGLSKEDAAEQISEEIEDLDEVSKATLGSYIKRASSSAVSHGRSAGVELGAGASKRKDIYNKHEDKAEKRQKGISKATDKMMSKEDLDALFSGESLSEDFKVKASAIFETAVEARVEEISSELQESYLREFEEAVESVKEDFADKLDSYLDYVVENWMEENKLAIEKGLRTEIAEDFINALKGVFVEHYIDIPDEKVNLVDELVTKVDELEEQVNSQIEKNISLKKKISEHKKNEVIHTVCEGLTLSQVEKIKSLAKNVEFTTEEEFTESLETLKESYYPSNIRPASLEAFEEPVNLSEESVSTKYVDPFIEQVARTITKTISK